MKRTHHCDSWLLWQNWRVLFLGGGAVQVQSAGEVGSDRLLPDGRWRGSGDLCRRGNRSPNLTSIWLLTQLITHLSILLFIAPPFTASSNQWFTLFLFIRQVPLIRSIICWFSCFVIHEVLYSHICWLYFSFIPFSLQVNPNSIAAQNGRIREGDRILQVHQQTPTVQRPKLLQPTHASMQFLLCPFKSEPNWDSSH